ncbi:MAG: hypothetical protein MI723_06555 [Caulobacterales bacterium]|nr:hypothetical protein [Caulobacterales bacterium]
MSMKVKGNNLNLLKKGGCTSRVIDLCSINEILGPEETRAHGLLKHPIFDSAFVTKHNLRPHERGLTIGQKSVVTKVILPIDKGNFESGAYAIFYEQDNIERQFEIFAGETTARSDYLRHDLDMLALLTTLPSFDPFLLKERLKEYDINEKYFSITPTEEARLIEHSVYEMMGIVSIALKRKSSDIPIKAQILADKLFRQARAPDLDIFRTALRLAPDEYERGIFGWKGMMYYLWRMQDVSDALREFVQAITHLQAVGATFDESEYLRLARKSILENAHLRWSRLLKVTNTYKSRMDQFTQHGHALRLREFLLEAPGLFFRLGDDLSAVEHVCNYWGFWSKRIKMRDGCIPVGEALDLLPEFSATLAPTEGGALELA